MERKLLVLAMMAQCCFSIGIPGVYDGYQVLKVFPGSREQVVSLKKLFESEPELDFWRFPSKAGRTGKLMIPPDKFETVKEFLDGNRIQNDVYIPDVERLVKEDYERVKADRERSFSQSNSFDYNIYHNYDEIMQEMEAMAQRCPTGHSCETYSIGKSFEGRDLKVFKIFKRGTNRKVIWFDSAIHAREWLAPHTLLKIADHILTNYDSDAEVKAFLDRGDFYFMFVHNPDGYDFTWTNERLWRKDRYNNTIERPDTTCIGVDLNRNYMHRWGNAGTDDDPCSGAYRGRHPSSQIEVKNFQNELMRIAKNQEVETFVSIHTAARMVLTPWGSVKDPGTQEICEYTPPEEHTEVMKVVTAMEKAIEETHNQHDWSVGNSCDTIYPASGLTMDFARSMLGTMFAFTPELRDMDNAGTDYGFEAPPSEIQPSFEEMWNGFVAMFKAIDDFNDRNPLQTCSNGRSIHLATSWLLWVLGVLVLSYQIG